MIDDDVRVAREIEIRERGAACRVSREHYLYQYHYARELD